MIYGQSLIGLRYKNTEKECVNERLPHSKATIRLVQQQTVEVLCSARVTNRLDTSEATSSLNHYSYERLQS